MVTTTNRELEIVTPHPANYLRTVTVALANQLKANDTGTLTVPTLLARAKSLVNKKTYIAILVTKEDNDGN